MWNKTVVDHYSKLQNTVEVATFGSETVAARIAAERIIDLRLTAAYLGVHVKESVFVYKADYPLSAFVKAVGLYFGGA